MGIKTERKQMFPALYSPHFLGGWESHDYELGLDMGHLHMMKQFGNKAVGGGAQQQGNLWQELSGGTDLLPHCASHVPSRM